MNRFNRSRHRLLQCAILAAALAVSASAIATSGAAAADRCSAITGNWAWFIRGFTVSISPGGSVSGRGRVVANQGTWQCLDRQAGRIQIRWQAGGFVDTLTLSKDGNFLSGTNQIGSRVTGSRIGAAPKIAREDGEARPARPAARPAEAPERADSRVGGRDGDTATCNSSTAPADQLIAACGRLIASRKLKGANLAVAYNNRGNAWHHKGELDRAMSDYNEAIHLAPQLAEPFLNRATAWFGKGELDRAFADYNEAINLWESSDSPTVRRDRKRATAYRGRGQAWAKKGEFDQAIVDLTTALRIDPQDAAAYEARAQARLQKKDRSVSDLHVALEDIDNAIRLKPSAGAYRARGDVYRALSWKGDAIASYRRALGQGPDRDTKAAVEAALTEFGASPVERATAEAQPEPAKKPEPGPVAEGKPQPEERAPTVAPRPGLAERIVFAEGERLSRILSHPPPTAWSNDEKRRVGGAFATVSELAPGLMQRVTAYGPLRIYRAGGIGEGTGVGSLAAGSADYGRSVQIFDAFFRRFSASARRTDHYFYSDGPDIPLAVLFLIHELVHYLDVGDHIANSKEWRELIEPILKRVNDQLSNLFGETCYQLEFASRIQAGTREAQEAAARRFAITRSVGLPGTYSCVHPVEALAEYVTLYIYSPGFRASVPPAIGKFIQERFLAPTAERDPAIAAYLTGIQQREAKNLAAAAEAFTQVVRSNPSFAAAYRERAMSWADQELYDKAIADFTETLRLQPRDAVAHAKRGEALASKGEHDRAIADFDEAIRIFQEPEQATGNSYSVRNGVALTLYERGTAYIHKEQYDRAIADFDEALRQPEFWRAAPGARDPFKSNVLRRRGYVYTLKKQYDRALADFTDAIRYDPQYAENYAWRGRIYREKKEFDRAILDHSKAIELDPKESKYYADRARTYVGKGDYDRAVADFDTAISLNAKDSDTYYNRGIVYDNKNEADKAIADFSKTIELEPRAAHAYLSRGRVYGKQKQYDRALADFDEVIRINPKNAAAYHDRGTTYAFKEQYEKAIADFSEAIRIEPQSADSYFGRGMAFAETKNLPAAIADFTESIRLTPSDFRGYARRAAAYSDRRDFDRAIDDYTQAIKLRPQVAALHLFRGRAYSDKGDFRNAIADFNETIRLSPQNTLAFWSRADAYEKTGEIRKAIADFERLLELSPGHKSATEALKRLRGK